MTQENVNWDDIEPIQAGIGSIRRFDKHGDIVVGYYQGEVTLDTDDGEAPYLQFKDADTGELIAVSAATDLVRKIVNHDDPATGVPVGALVRIEYISDAETKRGQTPMKVFKVQARF